MYSIWVQVFELIVGTDGYSMVQGPADILFVGVALALGLFMLGSPFILIVIIGKFLVNMGWD